MSKWIELRGYEDKPVLVNADQIREVRQHNQRTYRTELRMAGLAACVLVCDDYETVKRKILEAE